jgi:hypothetical protein
VTVLYGCCVGWWDEFHNYVLPWVGDGRVYGDGAPSKPIVAVAGLTSIARAYNAILNTTWVDDLDALILLHTDLQILDPQAEQRILDAFRSDPDVALIGVAGGGGERGTHWWECNPIGHQQIDTQMIDFGAREGYVDVLEGSLLAMAPWAAGMLRFDEEMPGFHGYDEIALLSKALGKKNLVLNIDTHHHTHGGFKGRQSTDDWQIANQRSRLKWGLD